MTAAVPPHPSALSPHKENMAPGPRAGLQWGLEISHEFYADSIVGNLSLACDQHGFMRLGQSLVFEFSPVFCARSGQCLWFSDSVVDRRRLGCEWGSKGT